MCVLSHAQLFVIPGSVVCQALLSMGFSRQEYWSGLLFPSPGDLPNPGIEPGSPALQTDALPSEPPANEMRWNQKRRQQASQLSLPYVCSTVWIAQGYSRSYTEKRRGRTETEVAQEEKGGNQKCAPANPQLHRRPSNTSRYFWLVSCGATAHFLCVLMHTKFCLCPPRLESLFLPVL